MDAPKTGKFSTKNLDGYTKKNRFYLQDGSNIYRLLPPFGTLAQKGAIAQYWAVYWLADSKGKKKPVVSIRRTGKDKQVIQADPLYDKIEALNKSLEAQKANGANEAVTKALGERLRQMQLDKAYYLNVINPAGEIGVLKLRYTAFQNLKEKLRQLEKDGIDAVNVGEGVYLDFKKLKDDNGRVNYPVDLHMRTFKSQETGKLTTEVVAAVIDENVLTRMETEAFELSTMYKPLSPDDQALAATLDPAVIDRLFARAETVTAGEEYEADVEETLVAAPAVATAAPAQQTTTAMAVSTPVEKPKAAASTPVAEAQSTGGGPKAEAAVNNAQAQDLVAQFLATGKI